MKRFFRDELALIALMGAAMCQTGLALDAMNGMVRSTRTVIQAAPHPAMVSAQPAQMFAHASSSSVLHHPALQD